MLLAVCMAAASLLPPAAPVSRMSRRVALLQGAAGVALLRPLSASAAPAASEAALVGEVRAIQKALDLTSLFGLIDEEKFDSVRSVLKVPPVGDAWQQSQNGKNPFRKLADVRAPTRSRPLASRHQPCARRHRILASTTHAHPRPPTPARAAVHLTL